MKNAQARGMIVTPPIPIPRPCAVTVREETTGDFSTVSFADDNGGVMIQVVVTPEVKKILKGVCK